MINLYIWWLFFNYLEKYVKIWVFFVYVLLLVIIIFSIYLRDKNMLKINC